METSCNNHVLWALRRQPLFALKLVKNIVIIFLFSHETNLLLFEIVYCLFYYVVDFTL